MRIRHGRIALELHELRASPGPALLLLHGLYGSSREWGEAVGQWAGPVYALDFCGHGRSEWLVGGGYTPELLAADADASLAQIGPAKLAGAGLGAYVAVLLSGARPDLVPAALLLPGAGMNGGGAAPDFRRELRVVFDAVPATNGCDPLVSFLDYDVRPTDYAESFARSAHTLLLVEDGTPRPPWWQTVAEIGTAQPVSADLASALRRLAEI